MSAATFSTQMMSIPPIDYTSRDFESISRDMVRVIPFFTPEWTDNNLSDFGIVLQRLTAYVCDVLHFYLDRNANEAFLPTAITRRSVINLCKLIDFTLRGATPATVDITFTLQGVLPGDLLIPKGTQLQTTSDATTGPIFFETVQDLVIPAGNLSGVVSAAQGLTETETAGTSNGFPRQRFNLVGTPIIDGTLEIFIDEGSGPELWTQVDTFILSGPTSKNFTAQEDANNIATIFFGDNNQGKIPDPGAPINAVYRVGGGTLGNVPAHTITALNSVITFNAIPVSLSVDNSLAASGGEDAMSIDEARILGPLSLRALNRAVTPDDYVTLALQVPGVAKAAVVVGGPLVKTGVPCCCSVCVAIAPSGGGFPSAALKQAVLDYLNARKMAGTFVCILDPEYVAVNIQGTVFAASNFALDQVASNVNAAIVGFFNPDSASVQFGRDAYLSDLFRLIDEVPGVDHVNLTQVTAEPVVVKDVGLPNCSVSPIQVGDEQEVLQTWTVVFTSATSFNVRGTASGIQANLGTVGIPYTSDRGEVSFLVTCVGPTPPKPADQFHFITTPNLDNVPVGDVQIMKQGTVQLQFVGGSPAQVGCS